MSKQQTAVEWLENELKKIPFTKPKEAFEQAKAMEKEQIETAYNSGQEFCTKYDDPETGEDYYNVNYTDK